MKRGKDEGAGPVTAILVLGVFALLFAAGVTAVGAIAGDERSSAQHAADAAALAGAQAVVDDLPTSLHRGFKDVGDIAELLGGGRCLQTGQAQAAELARENSATLDRYCWNVFTDEVSASVTVLGTQVSGAPAAAGATAATNFDASACKLASDFTPPEPAPTPSASPTPTTPPTPPPVAPPVATSVDCGAGPLPVDFTPGDARFRFRHLHGLADGLEPRLVS